MLFFAVFVDLLLLVVFFFVVLRVFEVVATLVPDAVLADRVNDLLLESPEERALLEVVFLEVPTRRLAVPELLRLEVVLALVARLVVNAGIRSAWESDLKSVARAEDTTVQTYKRSKAVFLPVGAADDRVAFSTRRCFALFLSLSWPT